MLNNNKVNDFLDNEELEKIDLVNYNQIKVKSNFLLLIIFQKNTGAINMSSIVIDDGLDISKRFFDEFMSFVDYFIPLKYQDNPIANNYFLRVIFTGTEKFIYDIDFSNKLESIFFDIITISSKFGYVVNDDNISLFDKYNNIFKLYQNLKKDGFLT